MKKKISKPGGYKILAKCVELWSALVKIKAGYKSEVSGIENEQLHSHHILGRKGHALKFNLDNGICLTATEHKFGENAAHADDNRPWWEWLTANHGALLEMLEHIRDHPPEKESATDIYWRLRDEYDEMIIAGRAREPHIPRLKGMER
jgi:hypothetical protein